MSEYKPITGELRNSMTYDITTAPNGVSMASLDTSAFCDLCDAIDSIHAALEAECERLREQHDNGMVHLPCDGEAPSKQLAEWIENRGLVTGPLDANGELWHRGDMSDSPWGEIESIAFDGYHWQVSGHDTSAPWIPADSISHYHAPSVEDLLMEFADECLTYATCVEDHEVTDAIERLAAKLRLAGDAE